MVEFGNETNSARTGDSSPVKKITQILGRAQRFKNFIRPAIKQKPSGTRFVSKTESHPLSMKVARWPRCQFDTPNSEACVVCANQLSPNRPVSLPAFCLYQADLGRTFIFHPNHLKFSFDTGKKTDRSWSQAAACGSPIQPSRCQEIMDILMYHLKILLSYPIPNKTTECLNHAAEVVFRRIPAIFKKSLSVDNGKEFAQHEVLARKIHMPIYFAHPYHSWERGLNEHTNGLLRQYFPKCRDLLYLNPRKLARVVEALNSSPRKCLGYRTPSEVFQDHKFALQI